MLSHLQESSDTSSSLPSFRFLFRKTLSLIFQFISVAQSCPTLCDPMNHSTPGLPVHHHLPEFTQTHVHWVRDAIQPSHPLSSPSPFAFNLSQHQGLCQWENGRFPLLYLIIFIHFSSVQLLNHFQLFAIPWTTAHQASMSITNSQSLPKLMSIESVMPFNYLILCRPLLLLPSIFPSIRVFSNESLCPPKKLFRTWIMVYNWFVL